MSTTNSDRKRPNDYHVPLSYDGYKYLEVELADGIMTATLNRPDRRNAADHAMIRDLTAFFSTVWDDPEVRAIVVTGAGTVFCAGGDLTYLRSMAANASLVDRIPEHRTPRFVDAILGVPQPIVAAVNGDAIGWGACLALWCDVAIIADEARIGDPHVRFGLSVPQNALLFQASIGTARSKSLLLSGKLISGREAADWGLVARSAPGNEVLDLAREEARTLADLPPLAVRWTKRILNQELRRQAVDSLQLSVALEGLSLGTRDHVEALDAWKEKRTPKYEGK